MTVTAPMDPEVSVTPAPAGTTFVASPAPERPRWWSGRWSAAEESTRTVLIVASVGVVVFLLAKLAVVLTLPGSYAAAWFPATGVTIAAVAVSRGRRRHAILTAIGLCGFLGFMAGGRPLDLAVSYTAAMVLEAALAGVWLGRGQRLSLATLTDLVRLLVATASVSVLSGAIAGTAVWRSTGAAPWSTGVTVAVAHLTGAIVLLPLVMRTPAGRVPVRGWEFAAQTTLVLAVTDFVFAMNQRLPLAFTVVTVLVWTGLRLGVRAAALQILAVSALATLWTVDDRGPFGQSAQISTGQGHTVLQVFLLACTIMVLALTVSSAQRMEALARVSANERFLDALVQTVDVGLLVVDASGRMTMSNRRMREIQGVTGAPLRMFEALEDASFAVFGMDGVTPLPEAEGPVDRTLAGEDIDGVEMVLVPRGQSPRKLSVHGRRIRDADGKLLGAVIAAHDVTASKQHEADLELALTNLAHQRAFEAAVVEVINVGVIACDASGQILLRNAAQRALTGVKGLTRPLTDETPTAVTVLDGKGEAVRWQHAPLARALAGEVMLDVPLRIIPPGLPASDVVLTARPIYSADQTLLGAVAAITDVTAELAVQDRLRESIAFHDAVLAASPDPIFIVDALTGIHLWFSRHLITLLGYSESEIRDMGEDAVARVVHPDDVAAVQLARIASLELADGEVQQVRYRAKSKAGSYLWLSRRITPFKRDEHGALLQSMGVLRDVTDSVDVEERLTQAALHDPLTGLPNRRLLADRLGLALRRTARTGGEVAVLFCDLDGFKHVNDTAGHAAGDGVLVTTAERLKAAVRPQDTVARVGGDEFVIILELDIAGSPPAGAVAPEAGAVSIGPRAAAEVVARRITHALSRPIDFDDTVHVVTVSIGITFARSDDEPELVLSDADSAMYRAKSHGKDRVEIFDTALRADAAERGRVERILRQALSGTEVTSMPVSTDPSLPSSAAVTPAPRAVAALSVAYQPILDLSTQRIVGVEALARLHDAHGRAIPPDVFIPIAEEDGLIAPLGRFVLSTACTDLARWHADHPAFRNLGVSVNLSARQASRADLVPTVKNALTQADISPSLLTLELTESVLLAAGRSALTALREIRDLGVRIDIDDFGTGYASLRYLAELPVTGIKIDRSFTAGLPDVPVSRTIVKAIASLARDLNLSCVAEGIETDAQLLALPSGLLGQGYLLGRPGSAAEIDARLVAEGSWGGLSAVRPGWARPGD